MSAFRTLGSLMGVSFSGAFNKEHNHEKLMLDERLKRLMLIISRVEAS